MLDAAIQLSLQAARQGNTLNNGAGPSSGTLVSRDARAELRAQAAERRLARLKHNSNTCLEPSPNMQTESPFSSDEEPLSNTKKGKAKPRKAASLEDRSDKIMTLADIRRQRTQERQRVRMDRKQNGQEEAAMVRELGRRLTWVNVSSVHILATLTISQYRPKKPRLHYVSTTLGLGMFGATWRKAYRSYSLRELNSPKT
jgi:hypothetical protein